MTRNTRIAKLKDWNRVVLRDIFLAAKSEPNEKGSLPVTTTADLTQSPNSSEDIAQVLDEFHLFSKLPLELRTKIWQECFPRDRLIAFWIAIRIEHTYYIGGQLMFPTYKARRYPIPVTLTINHESRVETLRNYGPLLHSQTGQVKDSQVIANAIRLDTKLSGYTKGIDPMTYVIGDGFCKCFNFKRDTLLLDAEYMQPGPIGHKWLVEVCSSLNKVTVGKIQKVQITIYREFGWRYRRAGWHFEGAREVFRHFSDLKEVRVVAKASSSSAFRGKKMMMMMQEEVALARDVCLDLEAELRKCTESSSEFRMPTVVFIPPGKE